MVLTEAAGDAELVLWDGRELAHWQRDFTCLQNQYRSRVQKGCFCGYK